MAAATPNSPPSPQDVLAQTASFLAPDLLLPDKHYFSAETAERIKPFDPPLDSWKLLVSQDAKGVGRYTVHRNETRFVMRCSFKGVQLESLYRLLTETNRRSQWDVKLEASRVVEVLESPLAAIVEFYKLAGTFPIIKQRELVLLSCATTLPETPDKRIRIMGGSTSIDHPDVPYSKSHMRFISSLSGYIFTSTEDGVELVQMQDFGYLANYVPSSALRLALTAILPKTLLSFKNGALKIEADGSLDFLPPRLLAASDRSATKEELESIAVTAQANNVESKAQAGGANGPATAVDQDHSARSKTGPKPDPLAPASPVAEVKQEMLPTQADLQTPPSRIDLPHPTVSFSDPEGESRGRTAVMAAEVEAERSGSWLKLRSPSLNATIDTRNKRLSYFEASSGTATPTDEQQKRLADILSTDEGLRALRRLSKAVSHADLIVEDSASDMERSTESLLGAVEGAQDPVENSRQDQLMDELADAIGLQLNVNGVSPSQSPKARLLDVKSNTQEASGLGWATAAASRAFKSAAYSVGG